MATPQNALLDQLPETGELTEERFRRMSGASVGEARSPRVAPEGLPAGPRWPALVQTAALLRFRHWMHPYLHRTYGDVFTVRLVAAVLRDGHR